MTSTLSLPLRASAESKQTEQVRAEQNGSAGGAAPRMPLFIPRAQLYFWTAEWQEGEEEALRDLESGRFQTFPDGASAASWLLTDED